MFPKEKLLKELKEYAIIITASGRKRSILKNWNVSVSG